MTTTTTTHGALDNHVRAQLAAETGCQHRVDGKAPVSPRKRRKSETGGQEYHGFARRILKAYGRRAGYDIVALGDLSLLAADIDAAMRSAIVRLRDDQGHSWAEIGAVLGVTRQAAQKRYRSEGGD